MDASDRVIVEFINEPLDCLDETIDEMSYENFVNGLRDDRADLMGKTIDENAYENVEDDFILNEWYADLMNQTIDENAYENVVTDWSNLWDNSIDEIDSGYFEYNLSDDPATCSSF